VGSIGDENGLAVAASGTWCARTSSMPTADRPNRSARWLRQAAMVHQRTGCAFACERMDNADQHFCESGITLIKYCFLFCRRIQQQVTIVSPWDSRRCVCVADEGKTKNLWPSDRGAESSPADEAKPRYFISGPIRSRRVGGQLSRSKSCGSAVQRDAAMLDGRTVPEPDSASPPGAQRLGLIADRG